MFDLLLKTAAAAALTTVTQVSGHKQADLKCLTLTQAAAITHSECGECSADAESERSALLHLLLFHYGSYF